MADRPYQSLSITELEALADGHSADAAVLVGLRHELEMRKSSRSRQLLSRISSILGRMSTGTQDQPSPTDTGVRDGDRSLRSHLLRTELRQAEQLLQLDKKMRAFFRKTASSRTPICQETAIDEFTDPQWRLYVQQKEHEITVIKLKVSGHAFRGEHEGSDLLVIEEHPDFQASLSLVGQVQKEFDAAEAIAQQQAHLAAASTRSITKHSARALTNAVHDENAMIEKLVQSISALAPEDVDSYCMSTSIDQSLVARARRLCERRKLGLS